jgi:hypothetical protein
MNSTMNIDQIVINTGSFVCSGIRSTSDYISQSVGCVSNDGFWSIGLTVFTLCGGAVIALLMWREKVSR